MKSHHQILIIGAGNAGLSVAAQLLRKDRRLDIAVIDPSDKHYYQPAWTLVGSGVFDLQKTVRPQSSVIPKGVEWIQQAATAFEPQSNTVITNQGRFTYDWLIVAPGIQLDWDKIKGLKETLGKNGVSSNYSFHTAEYTWECIRNLKNGTAIFHDPSTPIKCGGAPHKIMYMAGDYFRSQGTLKDISINYYTGRGFLFAVPEYEKTLLKVVERIQAKLHFNHELVEVRGADKVAIFKNKEGELVERKFDFLHATPPQSAPDFIKKSPLADAAGWVEVHKETLRHMRYPNIFAIGDASNLPTSKTGAAIRKQAPVLVANLLDAMANKPSNAQYDGYTACPLVTGRGKLVMAEFDYNKKPQMTFPVDQTQELWSMYQVKKRVLPYLYWNQILTGKA